MANSREEVAGSSRTHEPSLRELAAQNDYLKELFLTKMAALERIMEERDNLYTERASSSKAAIDAAFAASEKAVGKSDINAEKWRENANEWRAAMQDREVKFAGRVEVDNEFKSLRAELGSLKETRASVSGGESNRDNTRSNLSLVVSIAVLIMMVVLRFVGK